MRKREFERLLVSLDGRSQAQLRQVSQKVGSLNERREAQDLTDKRVEALGACPHTAAMSSSPAGEGPALGTSGTAAEAASRRSPA